MQPIPHGQVGLTYHTFDNLTLDFEFEFEFEFFSFTKKKQTIRHDTLTFL